MYCLASSLCFDDFKINAGLGEIAVPDSGYLISTGSPFALAL